MLQAQGDRRRPARPAQAQPLGIQGGLRALHRVTGHQARGGDRRPLESVRCAPLALAGLQELARRAAGMAAGIDSERLSGAGPSVGAAPQDKQSAAARLKTGTRRAIARAAGDADLLTARKTNGRLVVSRLTPPAKSRIGPRDQGCSATHCRHHSIAAVAEALANTDGTRKTSARAALAGRQRAMRGSCWACLGGLQPQPWGRHGQGASSPRAARRRPGFVSTAPDEPVPGTGQGG